MRTTYYIENKLDRKVTIPELDLTFEPKEIKKVSGVKIHRYMHKIRKALLLGQIKFVSRDRYFAVQKVVKPAKKTSSKSKVNTKKSATKANKDTTSNATKNETKENIDTKEKATSQSKTSTSSKAKTDAKKDNTKAE